MSVSLDYAKRQLRYWQRVVRELRQTEREEKRQTRLEKRKRREKISPTPPLKREGVRKEIASASSACAREAKINRFPKLEDVVTFAAQQKIDAEYATRWFYAMRDVLNWHHPKTGERIKVWRRYLEVWWQNRDKFDPLPVATESKQITINTKGLDAL